MNPISIATRSETTDHCVHNSDYLQRINVLDLLGVTSMSPTTSRPQTIALPEEENYGQLVVVDWGVLGKH